MYLQCRTLVYIQNVGFPLNTFLLDTWHKHWLTRRNKTFWWRSCSSYIFIFIISELRWPRGSFQFTLFVESLSYILPWNKLDILSWMSTENTSNAQSSPFFVSLYLEFSIFCFIVILITWCLKSKHWRTLQWPNPERSLRNINLVHL